MEQSLSARVLIDTDVLTDVRRGYPDAVAWFTLYQATRPVEVSIVTAMELIQGARNANDQAKTADFLSKLSQIAITPQIGTKAREFLSDFHLSHGLEILDAFIAATAVEEGHQLLTRNLKHFQMIPGLNVVSPY